MKAGDVLIYEDETDLYGFTHDGKLYGDGEIEPLAYIDNEFKLDDYKLNGEEGVEYYQTGSTSDLENAIMILKDDNSAGLYLKIEGQYYFEQGNMDTEDKDYDPNYDGGLIYVPFYTSKGITVTEGPVFGSIYIMIEDGEYYLGTLNDEKDEANLIAKFNLITSFDKDILKNAEPFN